jgi:hypothetical protein
LVKAFSPKEIIKIDKVPIILNSYSQNNQR